METSYVGVDVSKHRLDVKGLAELVERLSVHQVDQIAIEPPQLRDRGGNSANGSLAAARGRQSRAGAPFPPRRLASTQDSSDRRLDDRRLRLGDQAGFTPARRRGDPAARPTSSCGPD